MKKDFFEWMDIAPKYLKTLAFFTLSFCVLSLFIFVISYMRVNEFFSFDLLAFDNLWIFLFAFVYLLVFAFLALPFNVVLHYVFWKKDKKDFLFASSLIGILCIILFFIFVFEPSRFNLNWLVFCGFIIFIYFGLIATCLLFYEKKNPKQFFILIFTLFALLTYLAIFFPNIFESGFKYFLKTKGLSADRVEIYLKDKQKFVIGELIFRDSKFAYVRFEDNIQGLKGERNISKILSIEHINIIKGQQ